MDCHEQHLLNAEHAWVPPAKIVAYLLSSTHPEGRYKAEFFHRFGFRQDKPHILEEALLKQARTGVVIDEFPAPFGLHYVVEGQIDAPDGRSPLVWTIWIIEWG